MDAENIMLISRHISITEGLPDFSKTIPLTLFEICNPGRFPTGVTPENIKTLHSSKPRNLHIAQVMYKTACLEGWGTGIKRMTDVCKVHNLPEPFYQIWADGTVVLTFLRPKTAKNGETNDKWESLTERQNSIIQCLQKNGTHTSRTLSILLVISQRTVEREIGSHCQRQSTGTSFLSASFPHLFYRFSVTMESHRSLKSAENLLENNL